MINYQPSCTRITIGGTDYVTVLEPNNTDSICDQCDLKEVCKDDDENSLSLFCAVYVDENHYFKKVKNNLK